MNLANCQQPFLVGIKGIGMTALALIAKQLGKPVTGSDVAEEYLTDSVLTEAGIKWQVGFDPKALPEKTDYLVATAAHGGLTNPQVKMAQKRGFPALSYAQALADLVSEQTVLAVTGVGGKTTTTAMLATIFTQAGRDPSFVIGAASSPPRKLPGYIGQGGLFIIEADDYVACPFTDRTPKFDYLSPRVVVMTNLEFDHPDVYQDLEAMTAAYQGLARKIPKGGLLVVNGESLNLQEVVRNGLDCPVVSYGFGPKNDFVIERFQSRPGRTRFNLKDWGEITLSVPGRLNAMNATAAIVVANHFGLPKKAILPALKEFKGLKRRFEFIGLVDGVPVYDDYAHQPNEIRASLAAAREWYPRRRLRVVFQPHTYSRTKALVEEFAQSLGLADEVVMMDIFASQRERSDQSISSEKLLQRIVGPSISYCPDLATVVGHLNQTLDGQDLILTMGAGDVYQVAEHLVDRKD